MTVNDFSIQRVSSLAGLKNNPVSLTRSVKLIGQYEIGDFESGVYFGVAGYPPGSFRDSGLDVVVPTVGAASNGSGAWIREGAPKIYDHMWFVGKPNLNLSIKLGMIYEWQATLQHDKGTPPSARTIEEPEYRAAVSTYSQYDFLIIDIESLSAADDPTAIQYVKIAKDVLPSAKVTWWNLAPPESLSDPTARFSNFIKRVELVGNCDFCALAMYMYGTDTLDTWRDRNMARVDESRRLYGSKPLFIVLSPNVFAGSPWPFVTADIMGRTLDIAASLNPDGILLWSFEGTGKLQTWDENWPWVAALRSRVLPTGHYIRPQT